MRIEKLDHQHPIMEKTREMVKQGFGVELNTPVGYICTDDRRGGALYKAMVSNPYAAYGKPEITLCTIATHPIPTKLPSDEVCNDIKTLLGLETGGELNYSLPMQKHLYSGVRRFIIGATEEMMNLFDQL